MRRILTTLTVLLAFVVASYAQREISGKIADEKGNALIGASVTETGTNNGTITDENGMFSLQVSPGAKSLEVSYIGYSERTIELGVSNTIEIQLSEGAALNEIIVTGLGISRSEKAIPYSVQKVDGEDLAITRQINVNNALAGKVSGVQVRSQSGVNLSGDASIRIRGAGSINDKAPLYIVDGTPVDKASDINVDDIESSTVLKGPNAAALYGQRGDAGVILITTKRGSSNATGIGIDVNVSNMWNSVYILPKYQNSYAGGGSSELLLFTWKPGMPEDWKALNGKYYHDYEDDASWGPRMVGQEYIPWYAWYPGSKYSFKTDKLNPNPSNVRDFYEMGNTLNTNVAFSKSSENFKMRISYTNQRLKGILYNSKQNKNVLSGNFEANLSKKLVVSTNINYSILKTQGEFNDDYSNQSSGSFNQWFHRDIDMSKIRELSNLRSPDGNLASWNHFNPDKILDGPRNFYSGNYWYSYHTYFDNIENLNGREKLYGNVGLTYKITDKLKIAGYLRKDQSFGTSEVKIPQIIENSALQTGIKATYAASDFMKKEHNYEVLATYADRFFSDKLSFELNGGGNIRKDQFYSFGSSTRDGLVVPDLFTFSNSKTAAIPSNARLAKEVRSLFLRGSLGFNSWAYLDFSARNDWSSALPKDNNSYLYPSVGGSIIFTEFIKNTNILNYGKIRASWAQVGSDLDPYQLQLNYALAADKFNGSSLMSTPDELVDPNIKPALSASFEVGFDLKFFQNRFGMSYTYYTENKVDEIISIDVSGASGFTKKKVNAGKILRSGHELTFDFTPLKQRNIEWIASLNLGKNKTEVDELFEGVDAFLVENGAFAGRGGVQIVHQTKQSWGQIRGGGILKDNNGNWILDDSGLPQQVANALLGSVLPDFTGGLQNTLKYKKFSITANIDFQKGGKFFSLSDQFGSFSGLMERTAALNDKGIPVRDAVADGGGVRVDGVNAAGERVTKYIDAQTYYHNFFNRGIAEESIYDLSFVKLRELSIGYDLDPAKIKMSKYIRSLKVSLIATNPWLIYTKNRSFDPSEISDRYGENGQFPSTRSFGFNLNFGF